MGALCKGTSRSDVTTCHTPAMGTGVPALPITCCQLLLHGFSSLPSLLLFFWTRPSTKESQNICPRVCACKEGPGDACRDLGLRGGEGGPLHHPQPRPRGRCLPIDMFVSRFPALKSLDKSQKP